MLKIPIARHPWLQSTSLLAGVFILASCSSSQSSADPYRADMISAQAHATSDFERQVFADLKITAAEYDEAVQRYLSCVRDHGVDISATKADGYYTFSLIAASGTDQAVTDCRSGTIDLIEPLYVDQLRNPRREDPDTIIARCLVRHGAAPNGYDGKQYANDARANFANAPYSPDDSTVRSCRSNPSL